MKRQIVRRIGMVLLTGLLLVAAIILARLGLAARQVAQTAVFDTPLGETALGSTSSLTILPLYEEVSADAAFQSGHGVSYLIETDAATVLLDLGFNPKQMDPPPVVANMQQAGLGSDAVDLLVISHNHPDHVGGLGSAGFDTAESWLQTTAIYAADPISLLGEPAQVVTKPQVLAPGVATMGPMPFVQAFPFWLWQPLAHEQVLAVNVAGRGIVLITGCGHPSLEQIVTQAETLFAQPVVGIVGGLHYDGLPLAELTPHVDFLAARNPQLVALSPHDSATAIDPFRAAFPTATRMIRVGEAIAFGQTAVNTQ